MRAYRSQPVGEFLGDLRHHLCDTKAPEILIEKIDEVLTAVDDSTGLEDQAVALTDERDDLQNDKDDIVEELQMLLDAIERDGGASVQLANAVKAAEAAVKRHSS